MLPKKKRWAATIRNSPPTCQQSPVPAQQQQPSVPSSISSPGKNQWISHSPVPNSSSRPGPRHPTPPSSTVSTTQQTVSVGNLCQTFGLPVVSIPTGFSVGSSNRPGGEPDPGPVPGSKQFPPIPGRPIDEQSGATNNVIAITRADLSASLLSAIANSTNTSVAEMLQQQSDLLIQLLGQDFLLSYAQNFAKISNNINSSNHINNVINNNNHLKTVYDHATRTLTPQSAMDSMKSIPVDTGTHPPPPTSSSVPAGSTRSGQSLTSPHRSDTSQFLSTGNPVAYHGNLVSNSNFPGPQHATVSRLKAPDPGKSTHTGTPGRVILPQTNSPVFSNSTSSSSPRFSPNRRLSGPLDNSSGIMGLHTTKGWPQPSTEQQQQQSSVSVAYHPTQNLSAGFDLSTLSAVARQSGLIATTATSRMGPPNTTAFLSQWDGSPQLAVLSQNRDLSEVGSRKLPSGPPIVASTTPTGMLTPSHSANGMVECSDASNAHQFVGAQLDSKPRGSSELPVIVRTHTNSSPMSSGQDGHIPASASLPVQQPQSGLSRRPGTKPHPAGSSRASDIADHKSGHPIPPTDLTKPCRTTPPWPTVDNRGESQHVYAPTTVATQQSLTPGLIGRERVSGIEHADTRFAILQDAKIAALNVDWPTPSGSTASTGANKVQRIRSSSSFCTTSLSPNLLSVNSAPIPTTSTSNTAIQQPNSTTRISCSSTDDNRINHAISPSAKSGIYALVSQPSRYTPILNNRTPNTSSTSVRNCGEHGQIKLPPTPPAVLSDLSPVAHQHKPNNLATKPSPVPTPVTTYEFTNSPPARLESGPRPASRPNHVQSNQLHGVSNVSNEVLKPLSGESRTSNSSMPLKKRLIQRYEADSCTAHGSATSDHLPVGRWPPLTLSSDLHSDSPTRMPAHSPISPASQSSPHAAAAFSMGDTKPLVYTVSGSTSIASDKARQLSSSDAVEVSKRKGNRTKIPRTKLQPVDTIPTPAPTLPPPMVPVASQTRHTNVAESESERCEPPAPGSKRASGLVGVKRAPLKSGRKLPSKANDSYIRTPKSGDRVQASEDDEDNDEESRTNTHIRALSQSATGPVTQQRRRRLADAARRTRRNSSSASSVTSWTRGTANTSEEETPRRRMAAVNGTLLMMVAARAQRSNSSASASSCSLHSMDAGASNDEVEGVDDEEEGEGQNVDISIADESSHSITSSTASSSRNGTLNRSSSKQRPPVRSRPRPRGNKSSSRSGTTEPPSAPHYGEIAVNPISGNNRTMNVPNSPDSTRTKKPKRAAALAASAATAASAAVGAKRARAGSKRTGMNEAKRRRHIRDSSEPTQSHIEEDVPTEIEDTGDDESTRATDDGSSEITTAPKADSVTVLDEVAAALLEDKIPIDELLMHLPGPPNLARITEHSLHPAHSLDYYKRSQTPFVQLVSCNDPGLKQVTKCRACRQLKIGAHFDATINGECGLSSEDGSLVDVSYQGRGASATSGSLLTTKDGQFKRPNGRNSQPDKTSLTVGQELDRSRENREKSRTKKTTNAGSVHSSSPFNSRTAISASDASAVSPASVFCRFWGFRKLAFNNRGLLKLADFCHSTEASPDDRSLWEMHHPVSPPLSVTAARYILERAGMLFCRLLRQELAILTGNRYRDQPLPRGPGAPPKNLNASRRSVSVTSTRPTGTGHMAAVAWKRPVKGVREMCDVCETTMFNTHWVCGKCGYSVCVHCCQDAKMRQKDAAVAESEDNNIDEATGRDRNKAKHSKTRGASLMGWSSCTTTRQHHDPERLLLTALLPACTIGKLLHRVHRIARRYQIRLGCGCLPNEMDANKSISSSVREDHRRLSDPLNHGGQENSSLDLLADLALETGMTSTLKICEEGHKMEEMPDGTGADTVLYSRRRSGNGNVLDQITAGQVSLPPHTWIHKPDPHTSPSSCRAGSDIAGSSTVADGEGVAGSRANPKYRVLQLHQPDSPGTLLAFQHEWRQNRPVIVSGCQNKFDSALWSPRSFAEDFGSLRTPLVDCATGVELTRYPLRMFWEGFERKSKRLVSKDGRPLCLKLKDWPTTDDFAELQPNRFSNLMDNLPMPEYTCRDGQLNLASRLASFFVCPDLGPKLYVAYGTAGSRTMGTTNLHVDIADAINLLLYVGHPSDSMEESTANAEAVLNVMRMANVDRVFLDRALAWNRRVQSGTHQTTDEENPVGLTDCGPPGALWHIFLPEDTPALREFLTRIIKVDSGAPLEPGSDPIHDQVFYLDQPLLDQLYTCTGVLPCTIVQFRGDAVFVPAGAAHQVRNLNSCIKAAVDFVSPEHLPQCFQLIEEFRRLSSTHQNHEDKLQVKNMLFHAVKDALSVILTSAPPPVSGNGKPLCQKVDDDEEARRSDDAFDRSLSELFDTERLASAQLLRPSLLVKEDAAEQECKTVLLDSDPVRLNNRVPLHHSSPGSELDWTCVQHKTGTGSRVTKPGRARLPVMVTGSRDNSPSSRVKISSRPQSTGSEQVMTSDTRIDSSSPPSQNGSGTPRCNPTASTTSHGNPYDTHYLVDSGLTHRNGTECDFVVSKTQLG